MAESTASARDRPLIYVENDRPDKSCELISFITQLDYKLWWHVPPLYRPDKFAQTRQNIFDNICSVNMICAPRERSPKINGLRPVDDLDFPPTLPAAALAVYWLGCRPYSSSIAMITAP